MRLVWTPSYVVKQKEDSIANLNYVPMLEVDECVVLSDIKEEWIVHNTARENILFQRDTGVYRGM